MSFAGEIYQEIFPFHDCGGLAVLDSVFVGGSFAHVDDDSVTSLQTARARSLSRPPLLWHAALPPYTAVAVEAARMPVVLMTDAAYHAWRQWQDGWTLDQWLARQSHLTKNQGEALWRSWVRWGLLRPAGRTGKAFPTRPRTLTAWLQVTDACNLDCPYCYVAHRPRHMDPEVAEQVIRRLVALAGEAGYQGLVLKYAGGEPTLRWSVVRPMHTLATELAEAQGLALVGVLLTITISLDGLSVFHDRQRPWKPVCVPTWVSPSPATISPAWWTLPHSLWRWGFPSTSISTASTVRDLPKF